MAAVSYIRVSTAKQKEHGVSLEAQQQAIRSYCSGRGIALAAEFVDEGISGATITKREGVQQALEAVGRGDVLVFYSLSRLARSTDDAIRISKLIAKKKASMYSLSEQLDTSTAAGNMFFQLLAVFAEFERSCAAERTKLALNHKKEQGQKYSHAPYGFDQVFSHMETRGDKTFTKYNLIENAYEQAIIATMKAMADAGSTPGQIVKWLARENVPSKKGGAWSRSTIQAILSRE